MSPVNPDWPGALEAVRALEAGIDVLGRAVACLLKGEGRGDDRTGECLGRMEDALASVETVFAQALRDPIDTTTARARPGVPATKGERDPDTPRARETALKPHAGEAVGPALAQDEQARSEALYIGSRPEPRAAKPAARVLAIIASYNEEDIIAPVIGHLIEGGAEVYLIDNRSSDATVAEASTWLGRGLIGLEMFPPEGRPDEGRFEWASILRRKAEIALEYDADWYIHHDADEVRFGPWPGLTLSQSLALVDRLGFNCVDFKLLNFWPVDESYAPGSDPVAHFHFWDAAEEFDQLQLKCWKRTEQQVDLENMGGHEVAFEGRRVFPIRFLLLHYPVRSSEHGWRKIFEERKKRFAHEERARGWHVQYDAWTDDQVAPVVDPTRLRPFSLDEARLELQVRNRVAEETESRCVELIEALRRLRRAVECGDDIVSGALREPHDNGA